MNYDAVQNELRNIRIFVAEQQVIMEALKAQVGWPDAQTTKQILSRTDSCFLQNELIAREDIGDRLINYALNLASSDSLLAELKSRLEQ